jgi:hypothetical protein
MGFKLKGVGTPTYHLGGDFVCVNELEFKEPVLKHEVHAPLEPGDHPESDDSLLLDEAGIKIP